MNKWVVGIIVLLVLIVGIQTGYLIKLNQEVGYKNQEKIAGPQALPVRTKLSFSQALPTDAWDPFKEMEDVQRTMNRLFRESYSRSPMVAGLGQGMMTYNPDVDVRESDKEYLLRLDIPGIDKDKISVKIENNQIIVSGERKVESEQSDQQGGFYRSERSFGSFLRSFPLPADADAEKMTAEAKNGVLTVHIPKIAGAKKTGSAVVVQ